MNRSVANLLIAAGLLPFLGSGKGSANIWEKAGLPVRVLPPFPEQEKKANLLQYAEVIQESLQRRHEIIQVMANSLLPSIIEGRTADYKKFFETLVDLNTGKGSFNRQLLFDQVAEIKTNFPEADFWLQARGSDRTVGKVWRIYSNLGNEYGKAATSASKYDIGIRVKDEFRTTSIYPRYLSFLFEYYHKQKLWRNFSYGSLNLVNIRISEVRKFPIWLTPVGSSNAWALPGTGLENESCWLYNVLTDLSTTGGSSIQSRRIPPSYPHKSNPFEAVALTNVVPHDNQKYSDKFIKNYKSMEDKKKRMEKLRGAFSPNMLLGKSCPDYIYPWYGITYPPLLEHIEGYGVFVHTNRHKSSYYRPGKTFVDKEGNAVTLTVAEKSRLNLPERTVQVGIRGEILNPANLPSNGDDIDWASADFVYYSPHVPFWRKLSSKEKRDMEKGIRISLKSLPILVSAEYAFLGNQPGSRLPFVVVWGAEYR